MTRSAGGWFWRLGLRTRLMAIGVLGLAVILAVGGFALYYGLRNAIQNNIDAQARADAAEVAALIDRGSLPDPLPVSGAQVVQVLDSRHRVIAGSATADRLTPLLDDSELAADSGRAITVSGSRAALSGPLRVVSRTAGTAQDPRIVVVAVAAGDAEHAAVLVRNAALILFPALLAVLAVIAWRVIGRALQPVETLRSAAARISGTHADEQLPVPAARDEIAALAETLNDMLSRLSRARERQKSFVADAAHELRSPVASMQMQLEIAERGADPRATAELATDVLVDLHRLSTVVEDLLLLAKSDAGDVPVRVAEVDLRDLVAGYVERAAAGPVAVELSAGREAAVRTDPDKLGRAVRNLLDNALRHARSRVDVEIVASSDGFVIRVTDDGPGIPESDRERVLRRFTRLDAARDRDSGGAGLGLPIAAELISQLGGSIRLADREDGESGLSAEIRCPVEVSG